jgi:1-acyl-sn-glycerol-3-phosphate acyltransferase
VVAFPKIKLHRKVEAPEHSATPNEEPALLIDIERVFASKNPKLLKFIPGFIIRYLKRITHQDDINQFIFNNRNKKGLEFSQAILDGYGVTYNTINLEQIPADGRYLFASNHPLGGIDGIALITAVGQRFSTLKFPVNDILMNIKGLDNIFLPLNKHGGHSRQAALDLENAYQSDAHILMFPAGLVSRKQKGVIKDLEWKKKLLEKSHPAQAGYYTSSHHRSKLKFLLQSSQLAQTSGY